MISLDCNHPDLEEFIDVKSDLDKVTSANISIRMDDRFMNAVANNEEVTLDFQRDEVGETYSKTVNAREIFKKIAYNNWDMGEPGILFWDRINNWNIVSEEPNFSYAGTNPCAEEPLPAGGSCLLGSINLSEFISNPYTETASIKTNTLKRTVRYAVNALNDVLDEGLPLHPLQIQRDAVRDWRQIGLGVFGIADMLTKLGIRYGSEESYKICEFVARIIAQTALEQSCKLAEEFGAYPKCNTDTILDSHYVLDIIGEDDGLYKRIEKYGLRNSQILTIAPTGTLSTMLQVSGGIEPYFSTSWVRTTKSLHGHDVDYTERPLALKELMELHGLQSDAELPDYVITSGKINPMDRIGMQAIWQRYIDASISSTINLPNSATPEDVEAIYLTAWESGLKGVTVFRDGCRRMGILNTVDDAEDIEYADIDERSIFNTDSLPRGVILDVNDDLISAKRTIVSGCGKMYLHLDFDEITGEPMETFVECGSGGGCERNLTFISRLMSVALRAGVPIEAIIDQAMSIKPCKAYCDRTKSKGDTSRGTSCPSALGYAMQDLYNKIQSRVFDDAETDDETEDEFADIPHESLPYVETPNMLAHPKCPECGADLTYEGGCNICKSCGYSKCD